MKKRIIKILFMIGITSQCFADDILIFSPMPDETVFGTDVLIAASFYSLGGVSTDRIQVFLNDIEITNQAEVEPEMVSYAPSILNSGKHIVLIRIFRDNMDPLEQTWGFTVTGEKKWTDEIDWGGKITSDYRLEQAGEEELSLGNVGVYFNGSAYEWFKLKTSIKLASDEDPLLQPRNRFTLQASLGKYFDLGFGDTNPRMTRFTLDGKRVRGFNAHLKLKYLKVHFITGELVRAIDGNLNENEPNSAYVIFHQGFQDSLATFRLNRQGYTFKQKILAGRLSFGRGKNFQLGLNFLKVKDDINSVNPVIEKANIVVDNEDWALASGVYTFDEITRLNGAPTGNGYYYQILQDEESDWGGATPKDNLVISSDIGMYFDNKKILLEGEAALSLYNKDIWNGAMSIAEMDTLMDDSLDNSLAGSFDLSTLPFDPQDIEDIFVIGFNMVPLAPIDISIFTDSSKTSITDAILNMPSLSYRGRAKLNYFGHYFTAEYSRIGPEYRSLANPYLLAGFNQVTISDRIQLFKNRVLLTLEYRHQNDDVLTAETNVTTENRILTNMTLIPGPGLPTFTVGFRNTNRENGITDIEEFINQTTDSTTYKDNRENTNTISFTSSATYVFNLFDSRHTVFGTFVSYNKADQITDDRELDPAYVDPKLVSNVFNFALTSRYGFIPLKTTLSFTMNTSEFSIAPGEVADQQFMSGKLSVEYGFIDNKLAVLGGLDFMTGEGIQDVSKFGMNGGVRFKLIDGLMAQATLNVRQKSVAGESSSEVIGVATLSYLF